MHPRTVAHALLVLFPATLVGHPTPPDDVALRIPVVQVCPRFLVPVPEFFSREHPSNGSTDHTGHDSSAW